MKSNALSSLGRRTVNPPISWLMKMTLDQPRLISLAAGFTDNESLPVQEARSLLNQILRSRKTGAQSLQYGTTLGDPVLRKLSAERLQMQDTGASGKRLRSPYTPDRILITNGSQQLLYIITEALCDPGDILLLEDPSYFVYLGIAQSHGLRCRGIRLTESGIDLEHLEKVLNELKQQGELPRVKMLYLVSYFQNPTGITTHFERKAKALTLLRKFERAAGHPLYLLEDAAYRELQASQDYRPPQSAVAVPGAAERVIYSSTYSKPFATGTRVGFGLLPEALFKVAARIKGNHDFGSSNLLQQLIVRAISSGAYDYHLIRLRNRYAFKAGAMVSALRKSFPAAVQWVEPQGGLYVWARLPARIKSGISSQVFQAALKTQVLYVPGQLCYADDSSRSKPNHEMRLSFGGAKIADIRAGIKRLGEVLTKFC